MLAPFHPAQIEVLAQALASDGVAPHEARLQAAAELAGRRGADPLFVAIAADNSEPEVARLRAFGRLGRWLQSEVPVAVQPFVSDRCCA
jgi:hypothetical protein